MGNENLSQSDIDALLAGGIPSDNQNDNQQNETIAEDSNQVNVPDHSTAQPLEFSQLPANSYEGAPNNIDLILDVGVELTVEIGRKQLPIKEILEIGPGSIIELNKLAGEPVELLVNDKLLARGEVVVINENFGVRIIDIVGPEQRIKNLK